MNMGEWMEFVICIIEKKKSVELVNGRKEKNWKY